MTLATIAIPTFNRAHLLARAVGSALRQDYPELEVVIFDNASTDDTPQVCAALGTGDARVRYLRQPRHVAATANFDDALAAARGDYFMWLADDDWIDAAYVSECVRRLDAGAALVAGRARWVDADGVVSDEAPTRLLEADPAQRVRQYFRTVVKNSVFYGVARTQTARALSPLVDCPGADWLAVAAFAVAGPVDTVETAAINRSTGGGSDEFRRVPASLPVAVARHIVRAAPYDAFGRVRRARLVWSCAVVTAWRVVVWFPLLAVLRRMLPATAYQGLWHAYRRARRSQPAPGPGR
jgi:hypothetical protein